MGCGGNGIFDYMSSVFIFQPIKKVEPKKVLFQPRGQNSTVVFWNDGTKTVVKCDPRDTYNKETGLAMCYMKKALGNKGNFNKVLKKFAYGNESN